MSVRLGFFLANFKGKSYKFPLTVSLMGTKLRPLGIKATIYSVNDASESGVFLFLNDKMWEKTQEDIAKKKIKRYNFIPVLDNYYLEYILKAGGWEIIQKALFLDTNPKKFEIVGVKIVKGVSMTDQMENIVNIQSLVEYLKEKQDLDDA
jgi:hypothetical protein